MKNKRGSLNASFQFIARYPSALLIAGGILMAILNQTMWAIILIGAGIILHIMWLRK